MIDFYIEASTSFQQILLRKKTDTVNFHLKGHGLIIDDRVKVHALLIESSDDSAIKACP